MKELPKYFVIKREENNPLWEEYIDWLNNKGNNYSGDHHDYYSATNYSDSAFSANNIEDIEEWHDNSPTLITLEEWNECVNGFVLPDKWIIRQDAHQEVCDWFNNKFDSNARIGGSWKYISYYQNGYRYKDVIPEGYTEITYEQFKKYVLKENNMEEKKQPRTITAQQAQSIIDSIWPLCNWKSRLAKLWAESIVLGKDIEVSEELYKEMRSAANSTQNALGDKIFGKDKKEFSSNDMVDGEFITTNSGDVLLKHNGYIMSIQTGARYNLANHKFTGKKVKIKSIQWEEVK